MKYQLAIFDMDGTILNTLDDLANSLNYALRQSGFAKRTTAEVRRFVGNGIQKLVERGVPTGTDAAAVDKVYAEFNQYYKIHCADNTRAYDGIEKLLIDLKKVGCMTAVVSNKADYAVQDLCDKYFKDMFDFSVGEKAGINKKPSPDSVNEVLKNLGIAKENAVYIGDSDVDIHTAENAEMDSIIVEWGFRDKDFLIENGAKVLVTKADEIYNIITAL